MLDHIRLPEGLVIEQVAPELNSRLAQLIVFLLNQLSPQIKLGTAVHVEQFRGGPAGRREPDNAGVRANREMLVPNIGAWVEQVDPLASLAVDAHDVTLFVQIALSTAPASIIQIIGAAVDTGNDVIDVERPLIGPIG